MFPHIIHPWGGSLHTYLSVARQNCDPVYLQLREKYSMRWSRPSTLMPREIRNDVRYTRKKQIAFRCPYYRLTPRMVGTICMMAPFIPSFISGFSVNATCRAAYGRGLRLPGVHRNVETWPVTVDTSSWRFTFVPTYTTEVFTDWC